jgi:hypothetical protein
MAYLALGATTPCGDQYDTTLPGALAALHCRRTGIQADSSPWVRQTIPANRYEMPAVDERQTSARRALDGRWTLVGLRCGPVTVSGPQNCTAGGTGLAANIFYFLICRAGGGERRAGAREDRGDSAVCLVRGDVPELDLLAWAAGDSALQPARRGRAQRNCPGAAGAREQGFARLPLAAAGLGAWSASAHCAGAAPVGVRLV